MKTQIFVLVLLTFVFYNSRLQAQGQAIKEIIDNNYKEIEKLYKYFHSHPELSGQEERTSDRLAAELRKLGFEVSENVGGHGVVAVLRNGEGPTVMVRSDLDALPIREETGVPFRSEIYATDASGERVPVMHACGHDLHMSVMIGTAKIFSQLKDRWQGTLVMIGQPAEEQLSGARAMIEDGLFRRFPLPDYMLALHVNSAQASGEVGLSPGYAYANVVMGRIVVKGRGGHGAYPDLTVDPVVMSSRLVLALQTIVSREISALDPANITVGSIHGGTSGNIIPDEVELEVVLRALKDSTRAKLIRRVKKTCEGIGMAAGLPEKEWPQLVLDEGSSVSSVYNTPSLGAKLEKSFRKVLDPEDVYTIPPLMYGEDFGEYGSARPEIPAFLYSLGSVDPEDLETARKGAIELPSTHSSKYLPDIEPTIRTGILTMTRAVMDLMDGR